MTIPEIAMLASGIALIATTAVASVEYVLAWRDAHDELEPEIQEDPFITSIAEWGDLRDGGRL